MESRVNNACSQFKGTKPEIFISKELAEEVGNNFRVLPLFEKQLYEYSFKRQVSLDVNEYLYCKWRQYIENYKDRDVQPARFAENKYYRYYKFQIQYTPKEWPYSKTDYRQKLKVGPGVDGFGQMPIPDELLMKRGVSKDIKKPKNYYHD